MTDDQFDKLVAKMHQQTIEHSLRRDTHRSWRWFLPVYFIGLGLMLAIGSCFAEDVTIECVAPAERTDGTPITEPTGVIFSYGKAPDQLTKSWRNANPSGCTTKITGLTPGIWYFVAKRYLESGETSAQSNMVTREVKPAPITAPVLK